MGIIFFTMLMPTCWRTGRYSCTKNYFHWTLCKFNA